MSQMPEHTSELILYAAIREQRAGELLDCLFGGGSCTVDKDGRLVLIEGNLLPTFGTGDEI